MKKFSFIGIRVFFAAVLTSCLLMPLHAQADIYNDAAIYLKHAISNVTQWWQSRSISLVKDQGSPEGNQEKPPEEGQDDDASPQTDTPGMCQVPQRPPIIVCEKGLGFLCINSPEPGVIGEFIIVKGTIDRAGSIPASINIGAQHDYTKKTVQIDTSNPETANCGQSELKNRPFCLDEDGFFAARVPLGELGPYTIAIGATRFSGQSETQTVRTSRVIAVQMGDNQISFSPDVRTQNKVDVPYVNVTVSLLGDCQNCDLIGASTFAVTLTVENVMRDSAGNISRITCQTSIEQGGQGKFILGVPVGPGSNELAIMACNAATPQGSCPAIKSGVFQGSGAVEELEILSPSPQPAYSSSQYPTIPLNFKIKGLSANTCVDVSFNREAPVNVCPASDDLYSMTLYPQTGINVVTIDHENMHIPWVFGWGKIASPFSDAGGVEDGLASRGAVEIALPAKTLTDVIAPLLTNVIVSDELGKFVEKLADKAENDDAEGNVDEDENGEAIIPKCDAGGAQGSFEMTGVQAPSIGAARIEGISFEKDLLRASINADNIRVGFKLAFNSGHDGDAADEPIPLKLSFRKAVVDLLLQKNDQGQILLSAPHTDCDFKDARYCKGMPSALIPQNMVGDATPFGGFVICDVSGQDVSGETKKLCQAFNSLNAQTGLVNEKVLDAINQSLYCSGSKALTHLLRSWRKNIRIDLGSFLQAFELPVGLDLGGGLAIEKSGLLLKGDLIGGDQNLFSQMPKELRLPSVGAVLSGKTGSYLTSADGQDAKLRLAVGADVVNILLFVLTNLTLGENQTGQHGLFDMEISEPFFKKAGFDFVVECDEFLKNKGQEGEVSSSLCNLRPRISELLGTPLTKYGYFSAKQPILVRIRGNRALPPHLSIVNVGEIPVVTPGSDGSPSAQQPPGSNLLDLQIGGLIMTFYALEVDNAQPMDEFGNLPIKLDADGNPIIHSMRPENPDPWQGQIASFELTLLLAIEVGDVKTDSKDPSRFVVMVRPLADRSRLVISPVPGSNTTTIPPASLISALREKLQYGISVYSSKESAIRIPIPKTISFEQTPSDLFKALGLKTISFGPNGLRIFFDEGYDVIGLDVTATITQLLTYHGQAVEDTLPH